ncbi:MAG: lycopene cyclase domain-containing protein [Draconibacterium sp.]
MEFKNFSYLLLLLGYLIIPVILGFQHKVRFVFRLRYLIPATLFAGAIFVMWDRRFIELGIWAFNPEYTTGIQLLKVPVEEWLSFVVIPWSAVYIYEWLKIRFENVEKPNLFVIVSLISFVAMAILAYTYRRAMFSFFTFFLAAIYLGYTTFRNRFKKHMTKFYLAFFIMLLPYTAISAIMSHLKIVKYSPSHVMNINLADFPTEKFAYLFLMLLITITIYEYLSERRYFLDFKL